MENAPRAVQQSRHLSRCIVEVTSRSKRDRLSPAFEYLISAGCAPWIVVMDRVRASRALGERATGLWRA